MTVSAFIPVKGNSSRVPGKNTLPFADSNLLVHKIRQLKGSMADEIIVSSDSDKILSMACREGARAVKRPPSLSDESRPFGELVVHAAGHIKCEHMLWAPVTSPMLDGSFYDRAVSLYGKALEDGYDSLTTVEDFKHFLLKKDGRPYNFDPDAAVTNSQQLPEMYKWTCGCSIISTDLAVKYRFIFGKKVYCCEVDQYRAVDIDTVFDYEMARAVYGLEACRV